MNRVLIASHRGRFGGNIVENTLQAFDAALRCGADIVETDLRKTKDGEIICFHDPSPKRLLGLDGQVSDYTLAKLRAQPLRNVIGEPSGFLVPTLDEFLCHMKGRCMINLDQCSAFADEVYAHLAQMGMEEQALIKGRAPYDGVISWLAAHDYRPQFIPVIAEDKDIDAFYALPDELRIPIVEIFFKTEDAQALAPELHAELERRGIRLWINALDLSQNADLCARRNDTRAMTEGPEAGWGWLVDHGAKVIQTDWPTELRLYLEARGLR